MCENGDEFFEIGPASAENTVHVHRHLHNDRFDLACEFGTE